MTDITIPAADAKRIAQALRHESKGGHRDHIGCPSCEAMWRAADLLDPPPADISVTDAEHLSRAEARLDTLSPVVVIDPAMGVNITEQIKTLFQVVAKSPRHGAAIAPCDCLVCAAVHSIADTLLRESVPPPPSLRDEAIDAVQSVIANYDDCAYERAAVDAVLAVVRRHVEALDAWDWDDSGMESVRKEGRDPGDWLDRDDVLRLLGGDE